jgi:DNA-binding transcriptional LysR family regulator
MSMMSSQISQPGAAAATATAVLPGPAGPAAHGVELRHLRYFVSVADAGTFTDAAEQMFITQPTLSQQIRRLEEMVGAPLLHRRRDGVKLTTAGTVLLEESRTLLSLFDHGVSRTRQAAGLGQPRLRVVLPPGLPEPLAVAATSRLQAAAAAADVQVSWAETALDAEFSPIRQRRADAALGWLTTGHDHLPDTLDAMTLGQYQPQVWLPAAHPAATAGALSAAELAALPVIHGPRRASPATYNAWLAALRAHNPRFDFADPPFRSSLPMTLAFAATATRPVAVLTGPRHPVHAPPPAAQPGPPADTYGMTPARLHHHPLAATAALVWNSDLPRQLQQLLFDTADSLNL